MTGPTEPTTALAAIAALLIAMFFLFHSLPWSRPGPWRRIWSLAAMAALLFIVGEAAGVLHPEQPVGALEHQIPLFGSILAASAAFAATYFESMRGAERERILALTDPLTGLRNRRALQERVARALERGEHFSVLWADLDDFYLVNEAGGSEGGDDVLRQIGVAMTSVARSIDVTARVSGDAFALFLSASEEPAVRLVAGRALSKMWTITTSLSWGRHLSASFGAAGHADGQSAHDILEQAESAAARASRAGGGHLAYASQAVLVRLVVASGGSALPAVRGRTVQQAS